MPICLECGEIYENNRALGTHIRKHKITATQYRIKHSLIKKCTKCKKEISNDNKTEFCNHCRDRTGKNNPFYGKKHKRETIEKTKVKLSKISKNNWLNPEYRIKVINGVSKPRKESFKKEQSERITQWYIDNPEQIEIRRKSMKQNWQTGKIIKNGYSCNRSKIELNLLEEIKKICNDNMSIKTIQLENGKYLFPDIFLEDIGLVIEFYGDFWHANPKFYKENDIVYRNITAKEIWESDRIRIQKFDNAIDKNNNPVGYKTIIIWEYDYINNEKQVLNMLDMLINYETCWI